MPRKRKSATEKIALHMAMKARAHSIVEEMDSKQLKRFLGHHRSSRLEDEKTVEQSHPFASTVPSFSGIAAKEKQNDN
jgi:hypothetical protein